MGSLARDYTKGVANGSVIVDGSQPNLVAGSTGQRGSTKVPHVNLIVAVAVALERQLRAIRRDCGLRVRLGSSRQPPKISAVQIGLIDVRYHSEVIDGVGDARAIA